MDNFRKPKKSHFGSLDGFTAGPRQPKKQPGSLRAFDSYYRGKPAGIAQPSDELKIGAVNDFRAVDGFAPSAQAPIQSPAEEKPAEIGEIYASHRADKHRQAHEEKVAKEKRRGFLHFRGRKQKEPKKPQKHRKLKRGLKITGIVAGLLIFVVCGLALKTFLKSRNILKGGSNGAAALTANVDPMKLKGEGDGRVNILLLGKGGEGHDGPDLTDTLLLASVDPVAKEVALLSVPRDLWVKTPSSGSSKINAIYANAKYSYLSSYTTKQQTKAVMDQAQAAGIKAIESTLTGVIGVPIHYYAMVDFAGFGDSINAVGGIDINVKTRLYDPFIAGDNHGNPLIAPVGWQHFDGHRALLYAQSRHGSDRGDFDRTERQREVIVALKSKVLSLGTFANPLKVSGLIDSVGNHVQTDFSLNELMRVYDLVKKIDSNKIQSLGLADPPNNYVTTDNISGQSVVVPRAGTFDYTEIQSYVRNTLRDSYLKSENASIIILNGTSTSGLATLKSTELKSYGYNVTQVADAPSQTYDKTILVDLTKGSKKYTKNYLEKRLGTKAVSSLPDPNINAGTANFVIILGSNESAASN